MVQTLPVSICIATFRRRDQLRLLLEDMARQTSLPAQVVVVDNDPGATAADVVHSFASSRPPFQVDYSVQPKPSIALTRNQSIARAEQEWLAFIDDDERAPAAWLQTIFSSVVQAEADGALGPVVPQVPAHAPDWIARGRFYDFPRMTTGEIVPPNRLRFGNVLIRGWKLKALPGPFDPDYGLKTGEDGDMLGRLVRAGARIVWCDEAEVVEPVESKRLNLRWLLQRAYSGGQDFGRKTLSGHYGPINWVGVVRLWCTAVVQLTASLLLAAVTLPAGRHRAAAWVQRAWANAGKLSAFLGASYEEYQRS